MPGEVPGRLVRETWVRWAQRQPDTKPSWLVPWEDLGEDQREVDAEIELAVRKAEREDILRLAEETGAMCYGCDAFRAFLEDLRARGAS